MAEKVCSDCGCALDYMGDLGAPGVGQSWECPVCKETYWVHYGKPIKFSELEPDDVTMDEHCY